MDYINDKGTGLAQSQSLSDPRDHRSTAEFSPFGCEIRRGAIGRLGDLLCGGWQLVVAIQTCSNPSGSTSAPWPAYSFSRVTKIQQSVETDVYFTLPGGDILFGAILLGGGRQDYRQEKFRVTCCGFIPSLLRGPFSERFSTWPLDEYFNEGEGVISLF